jgi:hypothetical protein
MAYGQHESCLSCLGNREDGLDSPSRK